MPRILIGQIDVRQRSQSQPNSRKPEVEKTRKTQSYTDDSHTKGKQALRCQFPQLPARMAKKEWECPRVGRIKGESKDRAQI